MPLSDTDPEALAAEVAPHVRTLQVIHGALMGGVVAYFAFLASQGLELSADEAPVPLMPIGFAVTSVVMSFVVPRLVRRSGLADLRGKSDTTVPSVVRPFETAHIIGMAMLEGAGFMTCFGLAGGFGGTPRWFLAVPIAIIALMAIRFPWAASVADWVTSAREALARDAEDS